MKKTFWFEHYRTRLCTPRTELNCDVSLKTKAGLRKSLLSDLSDVNSFICCVKPVSTGCVELAHKQ